MKNSRLPPRVSETALIIQGQIENLTPQQVLARDSLVGDGLSLDLATEFIQTFCPMNEGMITDIRAWVEKNKVDPEIGQMILNRATKGLAMSVASQLAEQTSESDWRTKNWAIENSGNP